MSYLTRMGEWEELIGRKHEPVRCAPQSLHHHLAFRVLVGAAHPDLADALMVYPICQEELYDPGQDVSINPNKNGSSGKWGGGDVVGTFRIPNLLPVRLSI